MEGLIAILGRTAAFSFAAGINLYATVAILGLVSRFKWVDLPPQFAIFDNNIVIGVALLLYVIEFFADKIPGLDSLWDMIHTVVRIPAGAALAASVFGADQASWAMAAALMGGTLAATSHVAKATTRAAINTSPEPFSNIAMSLLGDSVVPASLWLSWEHPYVFFGVLAVVIVISLVLIWVLAKFLRQLARRVSGLFATRQPSV